jgi:hypothetical protein
MQSISLENNNVSKASGSRQILNVSVPSFPLPVLQSWPSKKSNHFAVRLLFLSLSLCARYWCQRSSLDSGTCMKTHGIAHGALNHHLLVNSGSCEIGHKMLMVLS